MQHRANTPESGRHRRTAPLHRAPASPLGDRGRHAFLTAALVAGVAAAPAAATPVQPDATIGHAEAQLALLRTAAGAQAMAYSAPLPGPAASQGAAPAAGSPGTTRATSGAGTTRAVNGQTTNGQTTNGQTTNGQTTSAQGVSRAAGQGPRRSAVAARGSAARVATGSRPAAGHDPASAIPAPTVRQVAEEAARALTYARTRLKARPVVAPQIVAPQWVHPLPEAAVTSCFGQRWGRLHAGVDLAAPNGTRIRAVGAGTVVAAGPEAGYGNAVLIDHGNGYLTHYGHMSAIAVLVGQRVAAGQAIGDEGSTGHSTGPHLHFEVREGGYRTPIEPTAWMHAHGVDILGCVPL